MPIRPKGPIVQKIEQQKQREADYNAAYEEAGEPTVYSRGMESRIPLNEAAKVSRESGPVQGALTYGTSLLQAHQPGGMAVGLLDDLAPVLGTALKALKGQGGGIDPRLVERILGIYNKSAAEGMPGATVAQSGKPLEVGKSSNWMVSPFLNEGEAAARGVSTPSISREGPPTADILRSWLSDPKVRKAMEERPELAAGLWTNEGRTAYDLSYPAKSEAAAMNIGQKSGQQAIFGLKNATELPAELNRAPSNVRLSSIPGVEERIQQVYRSLNPKGGTEAYEAGAILKKSLGEELGFPRWYTSAKESADMFRTPEDWDLFHRLYATTSPRSAAGSTNIDYALRAMRLVKQGATPEQIRKTFMSAYAENIISIMQNQGTRLSGPKVLEFNEAIPSLKNPSGSDLAAPADVYGIQMYTEGRKIPQVDQAEVGRVVTQKMREDAQKMGTSPREFQETAWRGYVAAKMGDMYSSTQPLGALVRGRMEGYGIKNISDWALKKGVSLPVALYLLGKGPGNESTVGQPSGEQRSSR